MERHLKLNDCTPSLYGTSLKWGISVCGRGISVVIMANAEFKFGDLRLRSKISLRNSCVRKLIWRKLNFAVPLAIAKPPNLIIIAKSRAIHDDGARKRRRERKARKAANHDAISPSKKR